MTPGGGPQVQPLKESDDLEINRQGEFFFKCGEKMRMSLRIHHYWPLSTTQNVFETCSSYANIIK